MQQVPPRNTNVNTSDSHVLLSHKEPHLNKSQNLQNYHYPSQPNSDGYQDGLHPTHQLFPLVRLISSFPFSHVDESAFFSL
jgi:hypothetical protein